MLSSQREQQGTSQGEVGRLGLSNYLVPLALASIVALALYLRWDRLFNAEFNYDQAWSLNRAYEFLANGDFPFFGEISSRGVPHGPVEIYLLTLPLLVSRDPVVATAFVGLLQTVAVLFTYVLGARYFDRRVGLIAAFLFAVNPWAITFGRKLWPPSMMPMLSVLFFMALFAAVVDRRPRWLIAAGALGAALAMTHPAGFVFLPLLAIVVVANWRRLSFAVVVGALVAALAVASPYLFYDWQHGFAFLLGYSAVPGAAEATIDLSSLRLAFDMASEGGLRDTLSSGPGAPAPVLFPPVDLLISALLLGGLLVSSLRAIAPPAGERGEGRQEANLLLLLWFGVPVVVTMRHALDLNAAYFVALWPVQFLLTGLALVTAFDWLADRFAPTSGRAEFVAGALLLVLTAVGASQVSYVRASVDRSASVVQTGEWGVPLSLSKEAVARASSLHGRLNDAPVYLYSSHNQWTALHYLARPRLTLEKVEPAQNLVLPAQLDRGAVLMIAANDAAGEPLGFEALADSSPVIASAHELGFVDLPEEGVRSEGGREYFRFLYLDPARAQSALADLRRPATTLTLGNGLTLEGLRYPSPVSPGSAATLTAVWRMPVDPSQHPWQDYVLFAHLVDATGRAVAKVDWPVFQYRLLWRGGDYLVSEHTFDVPADSQHGLLWLDLGAYEYYSRANVPWQDASGRQTGAVAKYGPLKVSAGTVAGPSVAVTASFGGVLALDGYDLEAPSGAKTGEVAVRLHWRAIKRPGADYVVSIQLLDSTGRLVGQHDSPPRNGNLPTSSWDSGERVVDPHDVSLDAPGAKPYRVVVVVYHALTKERLRVGSADYLELTTLP